MQRSHRRRAGAALAALGAAALLAATLVAARVSAPTADDIIARWVAARGGRAHLAAVRSARLFGRISFGPDAGGPLVVLIARPPRIRTQFTLDGRTIVQGYDGRIAWLSDGSSAHELPPDQSKNVAAGADLDGPLVDHAAKGDRVALAGIDSAGGRPAWRLDVTLASGLQDSYFIDSASNLQVKWRGARAEQGAPVVYESTFHDYRPVGGVLFAFRIDSRTEGRTGTQTIALDSVQLNVPVTDADFTMPAAAPAAKRP